MQLDDLFTNNTISVRETMSSKLEICHGVPLLKNNKFTLIELSELMSIARKFYNSEDFTDNDCVRLRNSMVNIGFFEKGTGFDAYCAISDTRTKLRNIKNEYIYR